MGIPLGTQTCRSHARFGYCTRWLFCANRLSLRIMAENNNDDSAAGASSISVAQRVQTILENSAVLQPVEWIQVTDFSDGVCHGAKLEVTVVSDAAFAGKLPLARHRIVNECLESLLADETIHALTLKTWTKKQYDAKK